MYNVRGTDLFFEEIQKTKSIGTIEYAIRHPNVFIISNGAAYSGGDWLYYISPIYQSSSMTGNQYLWGNNPYSEYKMVNIKTIIAVRLNSTTIKIVCSTADFPRSSIFFSFPSPPNQKVMDLEVTPRRISTPFPSPFQDY